MSKIESAVQWAIAIAEDSSHGYSQQNRWGNPDYDCSSLVISAYEQAGVPVKTNGATYTGNMRSVFLKNGFECVTDGTLVRGDVLLNELHHTALYIGNNQMVEARYSESGGIYGEGGDQTGQEILVCAYRDYPWDCVLRYTAEYFVDSQPLDPVSDAENYVASVEAEEECIPVGGSEEEFTDDDDTESYFRMPELSRTKNSGTVNRAVRAMQTILIRCWYISCGECGADGDFGAQTESALQDFQRARGLPVTGICDNNTWLALVAG